jgi:anti-sigma factor RsiW
MSDDLDPTATSGFSEPDLCALSAFVDGELPEAERQAMAARLAADPRLAKLAVDYRAQRAALRALFADPVAQSSGPCVVLHVSPPWWRRVAWAACWVVAGAGLTWLAADLPMHLAEPGRQTAFAERADIAYAVFAPDRYRPVEMAADQKENLVAWLSTRLNRALAVPSLREYGFVLVGGRLLPDDAGPAAQFMYENSSGGRLALYVGASSKSETPVRLLRNGNRRTFYWVNDHTGYALSGQIAEDRLHEMAADVCGALGGHPETWQ